MVLLRRSGLGLCSIRLNIFRLLLAISLVETVNAPRRIYQFLLAREEWMAFRADFNVQVFFARRARGERVAAGTLDFDFVVFGMYSLFHFPLASFSIDGSQCLSRNKP